MPSGQGPGGQPSLGANSESVDISPAINVGARLPLLGRHIGRGADNPSSSGKLVIGRGRLPAQLGDPEVKNLYKLGVGGA